MLLDSLVLLRKITKMCSDTDLQAILTPDLRQYFKYQALPNISSQVINHLTMPEQWQNSITLQIFTLETHKYLSTVILLKSPRLNI